MQRRIKPIYQNILKQLRLFITVLGRFFQKKRLLKITAIVLAVLLLFGSIRSLPILSIKAESLSVGGSSVSKPIEKLTEAQGDTKVAESGTKILYFNASTMNLKVVDKNTRQTWNSIYTGNGASEEEKSLLLLDYLGKDGKSYSWNSFKYCTQSKNYKVNRIKNGVQIVMHLTQGDSTNLDDYMPREISAVNYKKYFLDGIDRLVAKDSIDQADAEQYKLVLNTVYQQEDSNSYCNIFVGNPPLNAVTTLIELSKAVGYTRDMLKQDNAQFNKHVTFEEAASFDVTLEATLDGDDFEVNIPTGAIVTGDRNFSLQKVSVLPNFGLACATDPNCKAGWIFVPDGSGALMKLNSYSNSISDYSRQVRDSDYYKNYYYKSNYSENLTMPVFGMAYGKTEDSLSGYFGIIESGTTTAGVAAQLGTANLVKGGRAFNKAYSTVDVAQFANVKVSGPYSTDNIRYLVTTDPLNFNYKVRYKLFGAGVTYFDMAKAYQQYLIQTTGMKPDYKKPADLYLEVIGTLDVQKRLLGVPYNTTYSMTSYPELTDILKQLKDYRTYVNYSGALGGGKNQQLLNSAALTPTNGSGEELQELMNTSKNLGDRIFMEADFSRVYDSGNGFVQKLHSAYGFDNRPVQIYSYNEKNGHFSQSGLNYSRLSPKFLSNAVNRFLSGSSGIPDLFIGDLATDFYADYHNKSGVTPEEADSIVVENLKNLSKAKKLALENPFMDKIQYGSFAADISRESSNYDGFEVSIPFRQLVMNGLIPYSTENVNMSSESPEYYILQSAELGAVPKFTITSKNVDILKYTPYSNDYSTQFGSLKDEIISVAGKCKDVLNEIGSTHIVGHKMLANNVFQTDYDNGKSVLVNYSNQTVLVKGYTLMPLSYQIAG